MSRVPDSSASRQGGRPNTTAVGRVPTSLVLEQLLRDAPADYVTLDWLIDSLRERSFGIVMFLIALVGLVPGASPFIGVLLFIPAIQMMLARPAPVLPRVIAARRLSSPRFARLVARINPTLKRLETVVHPRWHTPFESTKRLIGFVILLLGATLLAPIPFSHVIPLLVIMMLAFAFLEQDGLVLCIALAAAAASLAITGAAVWGAIEAGLAI
jgi:hypothetical protein